jgi:hypothetical protein
LLAARTRSTPPAPRPTGTANSAPQQPVGALAGDEREHHHHRVHPRRRSHDLRIQEVRLERVDADDPDSIPKPARQLWAEAMTTMGTS